MNDLSDYFSDVVEGRKRFQELKEELESFDVEHRHKWSEEERRRFKDLNIRVMGLFHDLYDYEDLYPVFIDESVVTVAMRTSKVLNRFKALVFEHGWKKYD